MQIGSAMMWYSALQKTAEKQSAQFQKLPEYTLPVEKFRAAAPKIHTVDDLMQDRRSLEFVLGAFQLEDQVDSTALIRKVLTEDHEDPASLANRLADPRYEKLAKGLDGLGQGIDPFQNQEVVDAIVHGFTVNAFEKYQGERADGVREAMYFKRMIGSAESLNHVMADKTLMHVVRVASGLPEEFQALDFDQQQSRLEKIVDMEDFKDPAKLDKFIDRFLAMTDMQSGGGASDPVLSLFGGGGGLGGISIVV